jgi:acyl dehydratase
MALDPAAVGTATEPIQATWTSKDALLYAVSIGAGTSELAFTTENTRGVEQGVFPTMPVVIGVGGGAGLYDRIGEFDRAMLVHGQQAVTLFGPIPVEGAVTITGRVDAMYDKGKAAVVVTVQDAVDDRSGRPLWSLRSSAFIRGAGGWGGDRGPSGPQNVPPDRAPDTQVTYQTSPDQALLYRLNGDRNPLHSDPEFAKAGGFETPILHGLCSYGFTGRALLHELCGSDPARFRHIEARFASPVIPGEALTISIWRGRTGEAFFVTAVGDRVVIDQGLLRYTG